MSFFLLRLRSSTTTNVSHNIVKFVVSQLIEVTAQNTETL